MLCLQYKTSGRWILNSCFVFLCFFTRSWSLFCICLPLLQLSISAFTFTFTFTFNLLSAFTFTFNLLSAFIFTFTFNFSFQLATSTKTFNKNFQLFKMPCCMLLDVSYHVLRITITYNIITSPTSFTHCLFLSELRRRGSARARGVGK